MSDQVVTGIFTLLGVAMGLFGERWVHTWGAVRCDLDWWVARSAGSVDSPGGVEVQERQLKATFSNRKDIPVTIWDMRVVFYKGDKPLDEGAKTGKNPTDRGKRGAKINVLVDQSGAPLSVVLTGANRHDKVAAIDLIVSVALKRPAHKEQHLCADKAYDASEAREFAASEGYTTYIKVNPRKKHSTELSDQSF